MTPPHLVLSTTGQSSVVETAPPTICGRDGTPCHAATRHQAVAPPTSSMADDEPSPPNLETLTQPMSVVVTVGVNPSSRSTARTVPDFATTSLGCRHPPLRLPPTNPSPQSEALTTCPSSDTGRTIE
jgi:hypothetical protein